MKTHTQLSIFIENKMGELTDVTGLLSQNKISIQSINLADASDFGLLRLIVDDPKKAGKILDKAGFSYKMTQVLAVSIEDFVGSFNTVVQLLSQNKINIEYTYTLSNTRKGAFVFKVTPSKTGDALQALQDAGVDVLGTL
ncbi:MAG: ACT domain-containing protein [Campylobacterota bacterium]